MQDFVHSFVITIRKNYIVVGNLQRVRPAFVPNDGCICSRFKILQTVLFEAPTCRAICLRLLDLHAPDLKLVYRAHHCPI
jgi:hypothetical protein